MNRILYLNRRTFKTEGVARAEKSENVWGSGQGPGTGVAWQRGAPQLECGGPRMLD